MAGLATAPGWSISARRDEPVGVGVIGKGSRGQELASLLTAMSDAGADSLSGATLLVDNVPVRRIELEHLEATAQALADFVSSIRSGEPPRASIEFGLRGSLLVQKSLDAMDHATVEEIG